MNNLAKFRAFYKPDKNTKDGFIAFYVGEDDNGLYFGAECDPDIRYPFEIPFLDDDFIVQRFTGLVDKNGKEVYEGDIIRFHYFGFDENETDNEEIGPIYYSEYFASFLIKTTDGDFSIEETSHVEEPCLEVVGNIYQNPEFLNK